MTTQCWYKVPHLCDLHELVRAGELLQAFHQLWDVRRIHGLHSDTDDRGDGVLRGEGGERRGRE